MNASISTQEMAQLLEHVAHRVEAAHQYLSQLDAAMGDGDHGVSMTIGFRAVRKLVAGQPPATVADLLREAGTAFQGAAGATVGALLGAAASHAAGELKGREVLDAEDLGRAFRAASEAVMRLGGARPGDKTLVDCLHPATKEIEGAVAAGCDAVTALQRGLEAGRQGMESTRLLVARKGRASRLGERTRGLIDPGAASCFLILQSAFEFVQQARGNPARPAIQGDQQVNFCQQRGSK